MFKYRIEFDLYNTLNNSEGINMVGLFGAKPKKKAFGGYNICFKGCEDTLESVFGKDKIAPSEMTKKLWAYVKKKKISGKD